MSNLHQVVPACSVCKEVRYHLVIGFSNVYSMILDHGPLVFVLICLCKSYFFVCIILMDLN